MSDIDILPNLTLPLTLSLMLWAAWVASWVIAALWSRGTVARPAGVASWAHYVPTLAGGVMLFGRISGARLWSTPPAADWLLTAGVAAGLAFTWWARLWLGSLWSGTVTRKSDHRVVDTGPYRLVRHPIYTGLIAAALMVAVQEGRAIALAGAAIQALGWWMKARVEERFLSAELGGAYDDYRRRTPMLIPFAGTRVQ